MMQNKIRKQDYHYTYLMFELNEQQNPVEEKLSRKIFLHLTTRPNQLHFTNTSSQVRAILFITSPMLYLFFASTLWSVSKSRLSNSTCSLNLKPNSPSKAFSTFVLFSPYKYLQESTPASGFQRDWWDLLQLADEFLHLRFRNDMGVAYRDCRERYHVRSCLICHGVDARWLAHEVIPQNSDHINATSSRQD